ncbi:MAG: hypothetical protein WBK88_07055 [Methanothrix sp.]
MIQDRLKKAKAENEELQVRLSKLEDAAKKLDEIEAAGQTEAQQLKKQLDAEKNRADTAEKIINDHRQLKELRTNAKTLIEKRKLREGAYDLIEGMIRPGDDAAKIEKEYLPRVEKYFPPADVGGGGRDKAPDLKPNEFNKMVLSATGRGI